MIGGKLVVCQKKKKRKKETSGEANQNTGMMASWELIASSREFLVRADVMKVRRCN
jgi:hypothetical protein